MFTGSLKVTIDDKGRLALPTRYRGALADGYGKQLVVTMSPECALIYPVAVFRGIVERIPTITDRPTRMAMQRLFLGSALEQELDAQSRVQIPQLLRERIGLPNGGDAVLVGLTDHFELWSEAQWTAQTDSAMGSLGAAFATLNI
jgi:MraZ protein